MPKNEDKWISTDRRSNKLVIRFHVNGFSKQFFIATGLEDTPRNRELVKLRREMIQADISLERFDASLQSYQFQPSRNSATLYRLSQSYDYDLGELWEKFTEFKKALLERTTIYGKYKGIARYIAKLPTKSLNQAPQIRDWLLTNTTHFMAWTLLQSFSDCCNWAVDSGLIANNPFEKLKIKKPRRSSEDDDDYRAFTLEQRDTIIATFENHRVYSHHANLVKFMFWTGCRPGEAFALTWADVQENATRILINKSCNLFRVKKGTKNRKKRIFPTSKGSKLQNLLLGMKPPAGEFSPHSLVFTSKTGRPLNSCIVQQFWSLKVKSGKNGYRREYPGVIRELAAVGKTPYLEFYATRHTFATWAIASGVTPEKVARWIGDEVQTVLKFYCHPNVVDSECPDF
ncbi:tyrosine-type recombinase/integrase [Halotia branconii]|uniref:Tyrosine-type recombinase/integrase n=1 Tax=Halotia branconii CENA392 TaxID=1539056 RepID=A0AAJ6NSN3_9CYAN|nr:tyrosine-type recombinase/integrase [Halotia branconii]WGV25993.1 tyrosine-type recombinase/integrase [Halotia branconii CENA392]